MRVSRWGYQYGKREAAMTKQDFLNTLRLALNGKMSSSKVDENIAYYEDYINTQVRMGQSEEEVLRALGDPRLIARSVAEAAVSGPDGSDYGRRAQSERDGRERGRFRLPGWLWVFLIVFFIVLVLGAVFSILWALLPVLIPVVLVWVIINTIRKSS